MRKKINWLHKWLGILTGSIVLLVSVSGCLYVFQDDLKVLFYPKKYFIESESFNKNKQIELTTLIAIAEKALPNNQKISRVEVFPQKKRTWVFKALKTNNNALFYTNYHIYHKQVFLNPFTGEVQQIENSKKEFFNIVLQIHMNLLLGKKYGSLIVGIATLLFAIIGLSGLVLWMPKKLKKHHLKQAFTIKTSAKIKRLNYDLHNVLGFYTLPFVLIFCFTGLIFAFPTFKDFVTNSFDSFQQNKTVKSTTYEFIPQKNANSLNNGLTYVLQNHANASQISIRLKDKNEPHDFQVRLQKGKTSAFYWYYFNQTNGQIKNIKSYKNLSLGTKITSYNYDLHTGNIGGFTTKLIAFFAALICASLPITGIIIWLNKRKKA